MSGIQKTLKEVWTNYQFSKSNIKKGRVFFHNIWGKYSDNTKAMAEAYHNIHPDYELIYEVGANTDCNPIPDFIKTTVSGTKECQELMYSSMVVIDNDWGIIKKSGIGLRGKLVCGFYKITISKNSLYVSTGHGTPLKKIGCDAISDSSDCFVTSTQMMGVLDAHAKAVYERITMGGVKDIVLTGSPRNDVLYDDNYRVLIKKKLGINEKKLLLFAPTFRTKIVNGRVRFIGVDDLIKDISIYSDAILNTLNCNFGGDWVIGLRAHPGAINNFGVIFSDKIIDANILSDMADYLCAADMLVTDYSSCMFDYMITKRPCILLWADEEEYAKEERGMYFSKEELPFPIANTFEGMISEIRRLACEGLADSISSFMEQFDFAKNAHASEELIYYIDQKLANRIR